jgi:hypothetical protein
VAGIAAPILVGVPLLAVVASLVFSTWEARKAVIFAQTYSVDDERLITLVRDISITTGVRAPVVCSSSSPEVNASTTAYRGRNALDISSGFREIYRPTAPETGGVILHEFGHLAHGDHQISRVASSMLLAGRVLALALVIFCISDPPSRAMVLLFVIGAMIASNWAAVGLVRVMEVEADLFAIEYNGAPGLARAFVDWNSTVLRPAFDHGTIPRDQAEYGRQLLAVEREIAHLNHRLVRDRQRTAMLNLVEQTLISARKTGPFGLSDVGGLRSRLGHTLSPRTWAIRAIVPAVDMHPSLDERLSLLRGVTAIPTPREWLTDERLLSNPGTIADTETRVRRVLAPWLDVIEDTFGQSLSSRVALAAPLIGAEFEGATRGRLLHVLVSAEIVSPGLAHLVITRRVAGEEPSELDRDWSVIDDEEAGDIIPWGEAIVAGVVRFVAQDVNH